MKGLVKRKGKDATKDCFIFEKYFSSKRSSKDVMDVGDDIIVTVKTNTKEFCKDIIKDMK